MTTDPMETRVARGAALLDVIRPGWSARINDDELAMESCTDCILGQLFGDYSSGWWVVTRPLSARHLFSAADHGFTLMAHEQNHGEWSPEVDARFGLLADAWRAEVRARTGGAS